MWAHGSQESVYRSGEGVLVAPGQSVVAGTCRSKQRARLEVGIVL